MREIKFRAWDKEKKEMTANFNFKEMCFKGIWGLFPYLENFNPDYLMQYTGLKDKNGKEIYEGDIVEVQDMHHQRLEVLSREGRYIRRYINGNTRDLHTINSSWLLVIGNIYENPELLKEKL